MYKQEAIQMIKSILFDVFELAGIACFVGAVLIWLV